MVSPDGIYLAGRITGGQGAVTGYEVWSFRTGKKVASLAAAPMTQRGEPVTIGYLGADQLLTLADDLQTWDIKTGTMTRAIPLNLQRGDDDQIAVSASGKLVAVFDSGSKLTMIDAAAGKVLGEAPLPSDFKNNFVMKRELAFSPTGAELALFLKGLRSRIVVWSVANGSVAANFTLPEGPVSMGFHTKPVAMTWLPTDDGWIVNSDEIIDRATGLLIYQVPQHREPMAEEYGPRRLTDAGHILLAFHSFNHSIGMETFPLAADTIAKARAAAHATTLPAAGSN